MVFYLINDNFLYVWKNETGYNDCLYHTYWFSEKSLDV